MAQFKGETVFKKAQISLEDNMIYEFTKDDIKEYVLSDVLNKFKDDNIFVELKFFEQKDISPENINE
ncbi:YonK family protein [Caldifermentibacillus hisashii]|uniref:YonK family protein n=1 Tax=Caldifermentibacillus hisashii TaxID=996558 RepID=A0ABU9K5S6_9BACI